MSLSAEKINKSWFENCFHAKINTIMLLSLYQIFIFLLSHLHFFLHFFFTFMENLFKKHPIPGLLVLSLIFFHRKCLSLHPKPSPQTKILFQFTHTTYCFYCVDESSSSSSSSQSSSSSLIIIMDIIINHHHGHNH